MTKYNIKLNSLDHDYEELTYSAVYPPMLSLKLENCQGYPRTVNADAFSDVRGADITVQDVLRAIHEDLRIPFSKRELNKLGVEERTAIRAAFKEDARVKRILAKASVGLTTWAEGTGSRFCRPPEGALIPSPPLPPTEFLCVG